jgi:hypothetical protein
VSGINYMALGPVAIIASLSVAVSPSAASADIADMRGVANAIACGCQQR